MGGKWWLMMCVWTDLSKLSSPLDLFKTRWYWMCDQHAWLCNHVARQTSWCSCWIEGAQSDVPPEGCNWWFDGLIIHERFYCKFVWIYCFNWYLLACLFSINRPAGHMAMEVEDSKNDLEVGLDTFQTFYRSGANLYWYPIVHCCLGLA